MVLSTFLAHSYAQAAMGGILIGLASWLLLASLGRVAGITDITTGALAPSAGTPVAERIWRAAFLIGLIVTGACVSALLHPPAIATRPLPWLVVAGLLVGFGTVLGSGCTSGHGVCGIGRRSKRSMVATLVFMGTGAATVFIVKLLINTPAGV